MRKTVRGSIAATGAVVLGVGLSIAAPAAAENSPVDGFTFYDAGDIDQLTEGGEYPEGWFFGRHNDAFGDDDREFSDRGVTISGIGSLLRNVTGDDLGTVDAVADRVGALDVYSSGEAFPKLILYVNDEGEDATYLIMTAGDMGALDNDSGWRFETAARLADILSAEENEGFENGVDSFEAHLQAAHNTWENVELRAYGFHVDDGDDGTIEAVKDGDVTSIFQDDAEAVPSFELASSPVNDEDLASDGVEVSGQNWKSGSMVRVSVPDETVTETFTVDEGGFAGDLKGDLDEGTYNVVAEIEDGDDALDGYSVEATLEVTSTYTVTFDANGHGAAPADQSVETGETATNPGKITANGWTFVEWRNAAGEKFDFDAGITEDTTVVAHWSRVFTDVSPDSTGFSEEITWLSDEGITTGYDDGTFRPKNKITREAMAAFLYRDAGEPEFDASDAEGFSDIGSSAFSKEILWLADEGITNGYDDGTFRPKNKITREAMAAFLYRDAGESDVSGSADFTDMNTTKFGDEITWLADQRITTGYGDNTFRPKNEITREAMAAFLFRADVDNPKPLVADIG